MIKYFLVASQHTVHNHSHSGEGHFSHARGSWKMGELRGNYMFREYGASCHCVHCVIMSRHPLYHHVIFCPNEKKIGPLGEKSGGAAGITRCVNTEHHVIMPRHHAPCSGGLASYSHWSYFARSKFSESPRGPLPPMVSSRFITSKSGNEIGAFRDSNPGGCLQHLAESQPAFFLPRTHPWRPRPPFEEGVLEVADRGGDGVLGFYPARRLFGCQRLHPSLPWGVVKKALPSSPGQPLFPTSGIYRTPPPNRRNEGMWALQREGGVCQFACAHSM